MADEEKVMISVIVPVYNSEKYLHECIDSILSQTYTNFELILVNDGSKDFSGAICDEYAEKDERVWVFHKDNGGVSTARNLGIENAKGEWLCFIDSDDWVSNDYLERFEIISHNDVDVIIQGYIRNKDGVYLGGAGYNEKQFGNISEFFLYSEKYSLLNSPCFKLFRNSIVAENKIRFDLRFSLGEDHIFTLEYFKNIKSFAISSSRGYFYRKVANSKSLTSTLVDLDAFKKYIIYTDKFRIDIVNEMGMDESYVQEVYKETNKWILFAVHSLLDSRRVVKKENKEILLMELITLLKPKVGVTIYSIKGRIYSAIFYRILIAKFIKPNTKIKLLKCLKRRKT